MLSTNILFYIDLANLSRLSEIPLRSISLHHHHNNLLPIFFAFLYRDIFLKLKLALVIGEYFGLRLRIIIEFSIFAIAHRERHTRE